MSFPHTFMPISMGDNPANGTSLVTHSHSRMAKLHMSADLTFMSSGSFVRAVVKKKLDVFVLSSN